MSQRPSPRAFHLDIVIDKVIAVVVDAVAIPFVTFPMEPTCPNPMMENILGCDDIPGMTIMIIIMPLLLLQQRSIPGRENANDDFATCPTFRWEVQLLGMEMME
jgi:hypothetical protein